MSAPTSLLLGRARRLGLVIVPLLCCASPAGAQSVPPTERRIVATEATRAFDPKLEGAAAAFAFQLDAPGGQVDASAVILHDGTWVDTLWSGTLIGGASPTEIAWDGRDASDLWCGTGSYTLRVSGIGATRLELPVDVVRLGVTEIEAQPSPAGNDEFQMVYFRKGAAYDYYATPTIHEYANLADVGDVSDLDQNDGQPRPSVAVHDATDAPVMSGAEYETSTYNYPLCYVLGSAPRLELTFGASATATGGQAMGVGYPIAGHDIRAVVGGGLGDATTGAILPGGTALLDFPALPAAFDRIDVELDVRWQISEQGAGTWQDIPGHALLPLRIYTILAEPKWKAGASGTRYKGPWVEVAEYATSWSDTLGIAVTDEVTLTTVFVHGFFGQNGGIPTAIEGVVYDAYPLGGDGGSTHYLDFGSWNMGLSRLLNFHANGKFVNCSDNMGATTTMLAMLGTSGMRPVRLGQMSLKAIWGIGAPEYTTKLWGSSHGFSYHHIVTNDDATTVSDTCMQLDEDGDPTQTPGIPGWNDMRLWDGPNGYNDLSSYNNTNKVLETLPGIF